MALVDYGSDSNDSSNESDNEGPSGYLVENPKKAFIIKAEEKKNEILLEEDELFTGEAEELVGGELGLPSARPVDSVLADEEGAIEDIAKPKDWEKKLAEKAKRKLEKKTKKREEKEKRRAEKKQKKEEKKVNKKKIDLFGGIKKTNEDSDEEERPTVSVPSTSSSSGVGLFSLLPAPKTGGRDKGLLLPSTIRAAKRPIHNPTPSILPKKALVVADDSSDDDEGDFFGLNSSSSAGPSIVSDMPLMPSAGLSESVGPSRPQQPASFVFGDEEDEEEPETSIPTNLRTISDEAANKLIFKNDYAPWGVDRSQMQDHQFIDVNVDAAIGPNVRENLLKNLNYTAVAKASSAPLPGTVDLKDKQAKRKHQITYLANLAVAREEALQKQWADNKQQKRMAKQKYGF